MPFNEVLRLLPCILDGFVAEHIHGHCLLAQDIATVFFIPKYSEHAATAPYRHGYLSGVVTSRL